MLIAHATVPSETNENSHTGCSHHKPRSGGWLELLAEEGEPLMEMLREREWKVALFQVNRSRIKNRVLAPLGNI